MVLASPFTGLVVPVSEADRIVRSRDFSARAHITLLAPFMEPDDIDRGVIGELTRFFAEVTPFDFSLAELCRFPGGAAYLAPEPAAAFRRLTHGLHRLFVEFPPYGGQFDDVVPHLTVPLGPGEDPDALQQTLEPQLPLSARATRAALVRGDERRIIETLHEFPFGTAAA